jgi:hypothetical protein
MARNEFSHTSMGNILEVEKPANPGLPGNRNDTILREAFQASPIYVPAGDADTKDRFKNLVLEGALVGEGQKGSGFGFSTFNRDFVEAPDIATVEKDNSGRSVPSPFVPNVASPNSAGEIENVVIPNKPAGGDFVGDSLKNPADSSKDIARLTIGSYGIGVSSPQD